MKREILVANMRSSAFDSSMLHPLVASGLIKPCTLGLGA